LNLAVTATAPSGSSMTQVFVRRDREPDDRLADRGAAWCRTASDLAVHPLAFVTAAVRAAAVRDAIAEMKP
jgi:hypothetical protein